MFTVYLALNSDSVKNDLRAIREVFPRADIKQVTGCYLGGIEPSYRFSVRGEHIGLLAKLAAAYNQESVLITLASGECWLLYPATQQVDLLGGTFHEIPGHNLPENYTIIDGKFYTIGEEL